MSPTLPDTTSDTQESEHALRGKIASLPGELREQLNYRLFDGHKDSQILPWLNDFPVVREILAAQFAGKPIQSQNLSNWRAGGFQRWLRHRQNVVSIKDLDQFAGDITQAGTGRLAPATLAVICGKILELLETLDPGKLNPADLAKCATAASVLHKIENDNARLEIAKQRLRQREMALRLKRDKQQRDTIAIARRFIGDARAQAIENAPWSNAEKIEALGIHTFGQLWEPRPVPTPGSPAYAAEHGLSSASSKPASTGKGGS
jgi:hypothetical protein